MEVKELFLNHRTCYEFAEKKISREILREIYDLSKHGPTSFNSSPLRIVYIESDQARASLLECMMPGNVEKTRTAPVTAILAYDQKFYEKLDKLFPPMPSAANFFAGNDAMIQDTGLRNSSLQAAYFMMVAREKGLECGPMSGFFADKVHDYFLKDSDWKVNFLCNLGYKVAGKDFDALPKLDFEEACKFI
jgi:nitroreductase